MLETRFTGLIGCSVPIQKSGVGTFVTPELAAALSEAGALGKISLIGFSTEKVFEFMELLP